MKALRRSGLLIPSEYKDEGFYRAVKEDLTRRQKAYQTSDFHVNRFYIESEKFLLIPRLYPLDGIGCSVEEHQHEGEPIEIEHNITPRSKAQELAIEYMLSNDNGILQLSPGVGKTVISIYMIAERKRKTMILVHRDSLADQWRDRILSFTNLKDDDISRLTSQTFESDLKKPITIITVQTFLSLLKRQRKEFLFALNEANIGIFIADEVHTTVGAPTFSECSIHVPAKRTYGLSATPYRYDGNGDIIEYHLGSVFSDSDSQGTMDAEVTVLLMDYEIDTSKRKVYLYWGGKFQRSRYLNLMKKSKPFTMAVRGLLARLKDERNMIVMAERVKLIDELYAWLNHSSKSKFYRDAKLDTLDSQITFTTPGKCRDGIDAPWKDCLILTSPISNIEQVAGRITRTSNDKRKPIIVDMVDYGCSNISNSIRSRLDYYKNKNWDIRFIIFKDKVLKEIDEIQALNIIREKS